VIASQGLGAATATIAKEAGVSNGSLFLYFDTKAMLVNELYVSLKTEMVATAVEGLPVDAGAREQLLHMWSRWLRWATTHPEKRRTLAQFDVSEDITEESHRAVSLAFGGIAELLEGIRVDGPMKDASLGFVLTLTTAMAEATIDAIIREPAEAEARSRVGFDAMWRALSGSSLPTTG
jgi:AcrR family transcriptional regulator